MRVIRTRRRWYAMPRLYWAILLVALAASVVILW
jgi:hypothetical protein